MSQKRNRTTTLSRWLAKSGGEMKKRERDRNRVGERVLKKQSDYDMKIYERSGENGTNH